MEYDIKIEKEQEQFLLDWCINKDEFEEKKHWIVVAMVELNQYIPQICVDTEQKAYLTKSIERQDMFNWLYLLARDICTIEDVINNYNHYLTLNRLLFKPVDWDSFINAVERAYDGSSETHYSDSEDKIKEILYKMYEYYADRFLTIIRSVNNDNLERDLESFKQYYGGWFFETPYEVGE